MVFTCYVEVESRFIEKPSIFKAVEIVFVILTFEALYLPFLKGLCLIWCLIKSFFVVVPAYSVNSIFIVVVPKRIIKPAFC